MYCIAAISNCARTVTPADKLEAEKNYQINLAMNYLYRKGCRRMRTVRLPKTGDADKYKVMGWAA